MSEISLPVGHESYAFACMRCGYGWEQSYDIEHHTDVTGHDFVVYRSEGRRVPSPLSRPACPNCGRNVVRIMRSGRISTVLDYGEDEAPGTGMARRAAVPVATTGPVGQELEARLPATEPEASAKETPEAGEPRRRSGFPNPFHRK
ncbi:hypothetical protein I3F58_11345 [Streptomyces sp. MUM 203J]|uniref:hypothetical protein n=1 Tax=Streptomyces sp. MUM 203J TaxID=2791990 RepID=UPI001F033429|nr:hypothetical protein [Streptomyces sp. MUM 203J]MCH0540154.1 hypothetical protein [Streptomyces sp. MUM 203J]